MSLQTRIEASWVGPEIDRQAVEETIALLDQGSYRVAEKVDGEWVVHQWLQRQ